MQKLEMFSLVTDPQLLCKWIDKRAPPPGSLGPPAEPKIEFKTDEEAMQYLSLAVSTHMGDFKGAATEKMADAFMDVSEQEFGELTWQKRKFEHCGVLHEQISGQVSCTQNHYVKLHCLIPMEHTGVPNEEVSEIVKHTFCSLLSGASWTMMTNGDIIVSI